MGCPGVRELIILKKIFLFSSAWLLFLSVVVPNSLQEMTAAGMLLSAGLGLTWIRLSGALLQLLCIYLCGAVVTVFYLLVGVINGAPMEAVKQILFVYAVSPLLWLIVVAALAEVLDEKRFRRWLTLLTFSSVAGVGVFFYLFFHEGRESVSFFIKEANIEFGEGGIAATLHAYGSLIFLSAGFFAAPTVVPGYIMRVILLLCLVVAAISSGRSALMLSIPIGILIGLILNRRVVDASGSFPANPALKNAISLIMVFILLGGIYYQFGEVNLGIILERVIDKLNTGGGSERSGQFYSLMEGVEKSMAIGRGHGLGVELVRDETYPWRYELTWVATLFRVGVLGSLVYSLPFLFYIFRFFSSWFSRQLSDLDIFMFSGFFSAFLASNTNPYIEGFIFQWMYVLPVVHFIVKRSAVSLNARSELRLVKQ
jgi:hypothetical protein